MPTTPTSPSDIAAHSESQTRDQNTATNGSTGPTLRSNIGWGISLLLVIFLIFSASAKFANLEGRDAVFQRLGWDSDMMYYIGIMEVIVAIFYLVPQTAFVGALLLTAYLGGMVATHVRVSDPFLFPIAIGVLLWIGLALRDERIIALVYDTTDETIANRKSTCENREAPNAQLSHESIITPTISKSQIQDA